MRIARKALSQSARFVVESLEQRTLLASVLSHQWLIDTAPQRLVVTFDTNMSATLTANKADLDNATTDTSMSGAAVSFSADGKTATFTWPNAENLSAPNVAGVLPDGNYRFVLSKANLPSLPADDVYDFFFKSADANRDRTVDDADYLRLTNGYNNHRTGYTNGDFNYSGAVDFDDLAIADARYETTLQPMPTELNVPAASAMSASEIVVNWQLSTAWEVGEPTPIGIRLQRSTDGSNWNWYTNLPLNATTYTDTGLQDGTRYYYRARFYGNDLDSAYTVKRYATTTLPSVADLSMQSQGNGETLISWQNRAVNASSLRVYWTVQSSSGSVTNNATVPASQSSYTIGGLTAGEHISGVSVVALNEFTVSMPMDDGEGGGNPTHRFVSIAGPSNVTEGAAYTLQLNGGTGTTNITGWTIRWGEPGVADQQITGNPTSVVHYFRDGAATRTVTASAADGLGIYNAAAITVQVANVTPLAHASAAQNVTAQSNFRLQLATFSDAGFGADETYAATINWGDGSASSAGEIRLGVQGLPGVATTGSIAGQHSYVMAGTYPVSIAISDGDGGSTTVSTQVTANAAPTPFVVPGTLGTNTPVTFRITNLPHSAVYKNELGIFYADDDSFVVNGISPGTASYVQAALTRLTTPVVFNQNSADGASVTVSIPAGAKLGFYLVQDDSTANYLANQVSSGWTYNETHGPQHHPVDTNPLRPNVWFLNASANRDGGYQHFQSKEIAGGMLYEVEDLTGGGDQDFNDFVFTVGVGNPLNAPNFDSVPPTTFSPSDAGDPPSQLTLNAVIRDFHPHLPADFQYRENAGTFVVPGLVKPDIGLDRTPMPTDDVSHLNEAWIESHQTFHKWFHDDTQFNVRTVYPIVFNRVEGQYVFDASSAVGGFYPINGRLFGNENNGGVNGNFTLELHTTFTYSRGQSFTFKGDDDVWVFVNGKLAIDLGGVHGEETRSFTLDSATESYFGLADREGTTVQFDMFYAERQIGGSNFFATTNLPLGLNHTYSYQAHAVDPDPQDQPNLVYSIVTAPAGATIDSSTGELRWIPPQSGRYQFTIRVTDPSGLYDVQNWNVDVSDVNANTPPQLVVGYPAPPDKASVARRYETAIDRVFLDPDGDTLWFKAIATPTWLTVDSSGVLHGTPSASDVTAPISITVEARDHRGGVATYSFPLSVDYFPPDPPTLRSVIDQADHSVKVTWSSTNESDLIGYHIFRSTSQSGPFAQLSVEGNELIALPGGNQLPSFVDHAPVIGFDNYYYVTAVSQVGTVRKESAKSVTGGVSMGPRIVEPPVGVVSSTGTSINLSVLGDDPLGENVLTYTWHETTASGPVRFNSENGTNAGKNVTAQLHMAGDYAFSVTMDDGFGQKTFATAVIQVQSPVIKIVIDPPASDAHPIQLAPGGSQQFMATALDQFDDPVAQQPIITWSLTTQTDDGSFDAINATYHTGALGGQAIIRASTVNDVWAEEPIRIVAVAPPSALAATPDGSDVALSWNPTQGAIGYRLYRSTSAAGPYDPLFAAQFVTVENEYVDHTGQVDSHFWYKVSAVDSAFNESAMSNPADAVTGNVLHGPEAPSNAQAAASAPTQINLRWDGDETTRLYHVYRGTTSTFVANSDSFIASTELTEYIDSSLPSPGLYYFKVVAVEEGVNSPPSLVVSATTNGPIPVPEPPSDLTIESLTTSTAELSWTDASLGETAFVVERSDDGGASWTVLGDAPSNEPFFTDATGSSIGEEVVYRVAATNAGGVSATTAPTTGTTATAAAPRVIAAHVYSPHNTQQGFLDWSAAGNITSATLMKLDTDSCTWKSFMPLQVGQSPVMIDNYRGGFGLGNYGVYSYRIVITGPGGTFTTAPLRCITGANDNIAQQTAFALFQKEEAKHRNTLYYVPAGVEYLFDQLSCAMHWLGTQLSPKFVIDNSLGGKGASARYSTAQGLQLRAGSDEYDVIHELVHALDDLKGWYGRLQPFHAEAIAYGVERLLAAAATGAFSLKGLERLNPKRTSHVKGWVLAWTNLQATVPSPYTVVFLTTPVGNIQWTERISNDDMLDIGLKMGLRFSESALRPIYNKMFRDHGAANNVLGHGGAIWASCFV